METDKLQSIANRCKWRGFHDKTFRSTKKWITGMILEINSIFYIVDEDDFIANVNSLDYCWLAEYCMVKKSSIGQYTGYKDIYEGDIVKAPYLDPVFKDPIENNYVYAVIEFRYGAFVVTYDEGTHIYLDDLVEKIEVVGNIHDNPELLEKAERGDLIK